jgi:hypothetical protein
MACVASQMKIRQNIYSRSKDRTKQGGNLVMVAFLCELPCLQRCAKKCFIQNVLSKERIDSYIGPHCAVLLILF